MCTGGGCTGRTGGQERLEGEGTYACMDAEEAGETVIAELIGSRATSVYVCDALAKLAIKNGWQVAGTGG